MSLHRCHHYCRSKIEVATLGCRFEKCHAPSEDSFARALYKIGAALDVAQDRRLRKRRHTRKGPAYRCLVIVHVQLDLTFSLLYMYSSLALYVQTYIPFDVSCTADSTGVSQL